MIDFIALCLVHNPNVTEITVAHNLDFVTEFQIYLSCLTHAR